MSASRFIVKRSSLTTRWDPFYFDPELVALEARVRAKTKLTLRDFAVHLAGGATPLKSEGDKHYATAATGVPFLRVQNLTATGAIDLQDVKHITQSAHTQLLERSQLTGDELLIKITGVGRMAVAAVVPSGFQANINQHIVAVRTKNKQTSEALAAYLNLDFVEKLASRRATGGTRPALDYTALLSIPVIDDGRIVDLMQSAYLEKKQLKTESSALLARVDGVLLKHLGITLPKSCDGALSDRIFMTKLTELNGNIFDPKTHSPQAAALFAAIRKSACPRLPLRDVITHRTAGDWGEDEDWMDTADTHTKCLVIRGTEFVNEFNLHITNGREKYRKIPTAKLARMKIEVGDLLIEKSGGGPDQPVGRVAILNAELLNGNTVCYSNFVEKIKPDRSKVIPEFLFHYLRFVHSGGVTDLLQSQTNGIRNLMIHRYLDLPVSLPPMDKQAEIVTQIQSLQNQAIALRQQALQKLEAAKAQVEQLVFGAD